VLVFVFVFGVGILCFCLGTFCLALLVLIARLVSFWMYLTFVFRFLSGSCGIESQRVVVRLLARFS